MMCWCDDVKGETNGMIVKDGVEGTEEGEIVFVGGVVSMPRNDIEG